MTGELGHLDRRDPFRVPRPRHGGGLAPVVVLWQWVAARRALRIAEQRAGRLAGLPTLLHFERGEDEPVS